MLTITPDPKNMAKALRAALAAEGIERSHSQCLELVAKQYGCADWNTLSAQRQPAEVKPLPRLVLPGGWHIAGTQAQDYRIGLDEDDNSGIAQIISTKNHESAAAFATLMQSIDAARYLGRKIRLDAELRCFDTTGSVTIWMRVDDINTRTLSFDNMEMRQSNGVLSGTQPWLKRHIVLDVPEEADSIHYGFFLMGNGHGEARNFAVSMAAKDEEITSFGGNRLREPMNLDFAEKSLLG